jgi:hypothetical protein
MSEYGNFDLMSPARSPFDLEPLTVSLTTTTKKMAFIGALLESAMLIADLAQAT